MISQNNPETYNIPKDGGGERPLGIPTVLDRVIQQALAQVMEPLFDPGFSEFSYGFRKRRGAHDAVRQAREYLKQGYTVAVNMDLARFFDSVNFGIGFPSLPLSDAEACHMASELSLPHP
jgi:RNA-directed DNA polymerase